MHFNKSLSQHILSNQSLSQDFRDIFFSIPNVLRKIEAMDDESFDIIARDESYHQNPENITGEENANVGKSLHPSHKHGKIYEPLEKIKSYHLLYETTKKMFGKEKAKEGLIELLSGSLAMNDSENVDLPYCVAFSSTFLMREGRSHITDVPNDAPTNYISYMNMTTEAMFDASAEFMGATVVFDILIGLAYYTKLAREAKLQAFGTIPYQDAVLVLAADLTSTKRQYAESLGILMDNTKTTQEAVNYVCDYQITNSLQAWVHLMGNKFRKGFQSIFTNLNLFSPRILIDNFDYYEYPNGQKIDKYIDEIVWVQLLFAKFFSKGIKGRGVTKVVAMPVVSLMIPKDSIGGEQLQKQDDEFIDEALRLFHRYNNLNVYRGLKLAMCCRLTVDKPSHKVDVNSLGVVSGNNGNEALGALRIIVSALPSVAQELIDTNWYDYPLEHRIDLYLQNLNSKLDLATMLLLAQRQLIYKRDEIGLYQLSKAGWVDLTKLASTYGGVGLYEATKLISGGVYGTPYTEIEIQIANTILKAIDDKCIESNKEYDCSFNMEVSIPAESMAFRLQERDVIRFGEENVPYPEMSNQFTPLTVDIDIVERLTVENELSSVVDPTGICHINIKGKVNPEQNIKIHRTLWENYPNIDHYAYNAPISRCAEGHSNPTEIHNKCVDCNADIVSTTSRSIGYFKEVETSFGKNRRNEFSRRKFTNI